MQLAFNAFGLFLIAFLLHLAWWRIRLPKRQLPALFKGFVLFFPLGLCALKAGGLWPAALFTSPATAVVGLLYFSLVITYVITYSALEGDSPTLSLMRWIAQHPEGVREQDLEDFIASRPFIQARLKALEADDLTEVRGGAVFIKGRPSLFFRIIVAWRALYGSIERGG
jgi:hypothetical protein